EPGRAGPGLHRGVQCTGRRGPAQHRTLPGHAVPGPDGPLRKRCRRAAL
ncbi:MAG: hypothetical protein AVDCRST_MAG51-1313, partial [uncultured Ramlibacter sp.]